MPSYQPRLVWPVVLALITGIFLNLLAITNAGAFTLNGRPDHCPVRGWCGCALADYLRIDDPQKKLWRARNWALYGKPAKRGCVGCIAVLTRGNGGHVGIVQDYEGSNPVIWSFNHFNAVGSGTYPVSRVIAWRYP